MNEGVNVVDNQNTEYKRGVRTYILSTRGDVQMMRRYGEVETEINNNESNRDGDKTR